MRGNAGVAVTRLTFSVFQFLLVFCTGTVKGPTILVPQTSISGYEDQPLLLQASCHQCHLDTFLQITWNMLNSSTMIVMYTIRNTSSLKEKLTTSDQYQNRTTVYLNGSLLIHRLLLSDQGMYGVTMKNSERSNSATISVTVLRNREVHGVQHCSCAWNGSTDGFPATPLVYLAMRTISVVISALVILAVHLLLKRLANK